MSSVVWLQRRTGLGFQLWDCGLFTVARVAQRYWFVGALNTWLPVPVTWMATLVTHSRSLVKVQLRGRAACCCTPGCRQQTSMQVLTLLAASTAMHL